MELKILFERDLLYPTENLFEFGSLRIKIFNPTENARVPVIIESKTSYSPIKYINTIIRIMQSDIFDRIFIDIKKNVDLYIISDDAGQKAYDTQYVLVSFNGDVPEFQGVNDINQ